MYENAVTSRVKTINSAIRVRDAKNYRDYWNRRCQPNEYLAAIQKPYCEKMLGKVDKSEAEYTHNQDALEDLGCEEGVNNIISRNLVPTQSTDLALDCKAL